ncbi:MAG: hypothetical protein LBT67_00765 [Holosporaceae bacterium]|jgi:hypothetical protein|nr:hypothetical protein [Holosporaceae bacterium]
MKKILCFTCGVLLFEAHGMFGDEVLSLNDIRNMKVKISESRAALEAVWTDIELMEEEKITEMHLAKKNFFPLPSFSGSLYTHCLYNLGKQGADDERYGDFPSPVFPSLHNGTCGCGELDTDLPFDNSGGFNLVKSRIAGNLRKIQSLLSTVGYFDANSQLEALKKSVDGINDALKKTTENIGNVNKETKLIGKETKLISKKTNLVCNELDAVNKKTNLISKKTKLACNELDDVNKKTNLISKKTKMLCDKLNDVNEEDDSTSESSSDSSSNDNF